MARATHRLHTGAGARLAAGMALAWTLVALLATPAFGAEHEVRPGENLTSIARRYGVSVAELARLNQLEDPNHLLVGAHLHIPSLAPAARSAAAGSEESSPQDSLTEEERHQTARLLDRAAREFGVPSALLMALTYTESRWRQDAVSRAGAVGVGQLLPATATWLATIMQEPQLDPRLVKDNVRMSARLLRYLLDATTSTKQALAAYYQGLGAVRRDGITSGGARYARIVIGREAWFA